MASAFSMPFLVMILGAVGEEPCRPHEAVVAMRQMLDKGDFETFYHAHCHKHLRDQIDAAAFVEDMKTDRGRKIIVMFGEIHDAIIDKKGENILVARPQTNPDEYEFILVQVRKMVRV